MINRLIRSKALRATFLALFLFSAIICISASAKAKNYIEYSDRTDLVQFANELAGNYTNVTQINAAYNTNWFSTVYSNCGNFVSFCVNHSTMGSKTRLGQDASTDGLMIKLINRDFGQMIIYAGQGTKGSQHHYNHYYEKANSTGKKNLIIKNDYIPVDGDLVLFYWYDKNGTYQGSHTAIMTSLTTYTHASGQKVHKNYNIDSQQTIDNSQGTATIKRVRRDCVVAYFHFYVKPPFHATVGEYSGQVGDYAEFAIGQYCGVNMDYEDASVLEGITSATLNIYYSPVENGEYYLYKQEQVAVVEGERPSFTHIQMTDAGYYKATIRAGNLDSTPASWRVHDLRITVSSPHGSNKVRHETYDGNTGEFSGYLEEYHYVIGDTVQVGLNSTAYDTAYLTVRHNNRDIFNGWVNPNTYELKLDSFGVYDIQYSRIGPHWLFPEYAVVRAQAESGDFLIGAVVNGKAVSLSWPDLGADFYSIFATNEEGGGDLFLDWGAGPQQLSTEIEMPAAGLYRVYVSAIWGHGDTVSTGNLYITCTGNTVTFDVNGGSGTPEPIEITASESVTLPEAAARPGYIFLGWATSGSASSPSYQAGETYTGDENITFYAVWDKVEPDFVIPDGITTLEDSAFQGCSFTYVRLGEDIETLGNGVFADCPNLKHVYMPPSTVEIGSSVFPSGVTIHGTGNSYARYYAESNGYLFIAE